MIVYYLTTGLNIYIFLFLTSGKIPVKDITGQVIK